MNYTGTLGYVKWENLKVHQVRAYEYLRDGW
jgi:hypothetical protein